VCRDIGRSNQQQILSRAHPLERDDGVEGRARNEGSRDAVQRLGRWEAGRFEGEICKCCGWADDDRAAYRWSSRSMIMPSTKSLQREQARPSGVR
jgi:hypothetical protein